LRLCAFAEDIASSAASLRQPTSGIFLLSGYSIDSLRFFTLSCRFDQKIFLGQRLT